ncbi:DUF2141 domain-containing protein [Roseitranquillus sediminis]|uniref:DUF2141 domain-containing protein n=1 Tax=Roseitranquillus sediminis TaxID=2809051 RepID=UPI001D0BFA89|nr:DUF2141 domain-containing protein [Roseitranquillus sediminis]MBM9595183.1 DUF2141 domain-containing protein [Roseitranquillus sediminis]
MHIRIWLLQFVTAAALMSAHGTAAADLTIEVTGVRSYDGAVLVAVCAVERFLTLDCESRAAVAARAGTTSLTLRDIRPGDYAVQAIHDENGNGTLDRGLLGRPREGMGFSRDAPMRMGPPSFADAVVRIPEHGGQVRFSIRYF